MSASTKLGLGILGTAIGLGALGDRLLWVTPWGLNVPLWIGALLAAVIGLARWRRLGLEGGGRWLVLPVVFFAAAYGWRDSPVLTFLNFLALLIALGLAALSTRAGQIHLAGLVNYAPGLCLSGLRALQGLAPLLVGDIRWEELPTGAWPKCALSAGRGLFLALPVTLIFGGLFASADAGFEKMAASLFRWDLGEAAMHLLVMAVWAWLAGGFVRQLLGGADRVGSGSACPSALSLGVLEIGIVLGALDGLFLAFVLMQIPYLFGGAALVGTSTYLSYAEYARRGFFELVTVAGLVLPVLLLADWLLRRERAWDERIFRSLAGALVAMLFVIMVSAVQRMLLYVGEFGLTELRVYTTAFMGWLAAVFLWFVATVLRGRRERFAVGALVSGFLAIALLNGLDPDALIVRTNAGRPRFDARYNASLSADAVPALIEALPALPEKERGLVAERIHKRWSPPANPDWRTWNRARAEAWQAVAANEPILRAATQTTR